MSRGQVLKCRVRKEDGQKTRELEIQTMKVNGSFPSVVLAFIPNELLVLAFYLCEREREAGTNEQSHCSLFPIAPSFPLLSIASSCKEVPFDSKSGEGARPKNGTVDRGSLSWRHYEGNSGIQTEDG